MTLGPQVGDPTYAADVLPLLPRVALGGGTSRNSTTTLAIDPDLQMTLGVGTYIVKVLLLYSCTLTSIGISTQWRMQSGAMNTPIRCVRGPATTGAGAAAQTIVNTASYAVNASAPYIQSAGGAWGTIEEECPNIVVSTAGVFGLYWAPSSSSGNNVNVQPGSSLIVQQIA
jgi:hypothetical protein